MKRIFIVDTNVLVSGLISAEPGSPTSRIVDAMLDGSLIHEVSPALLAEYRAVLLRPKLARLHGLDEAQIGVLRTEIVANAMWREAATTRLTKLQTLAMPIFGKLHRAPE